MTATFNAPPRTEPERCQRISQLGGNYVADSDGNILGVRRGARTENQWGESSRSVPAHVMSTKVHTYGHLVVQLSMDGLRRNYCVAVLVLEAFGHPRPPGHMVAYADGDPANCSLANLSWVPRKGDPRFVRKDRRR
jgi:HNH endonuclease